MITHDSLLCFGGRWGWVSLLVATALLCAPVVSRTTEIVPELHYGHEGLWDVPSEYGPAPGEVVWPTSSEPCLLLDSLELIRIGYGPGGRGGLLLIGRMWIIPVFTLLYYFYMNNRVKREETNLLEIFGEEYESYCCQVNRFVPSFNRFNWKSLWYFRWNLLVQNHGHWNFAGVLSIYLFFYVSTFMKIGTQ